MTNYLVIYSLLFASVISVQSVINKEGDISIGRQKCLTYTQQAEGRTCSQAPYQALLGRGPRRSSTSWGVCAGVIISDRYILTSGNEASSGVQRVALGVQNRTGDEVEWELYEVSVIMHPEYYDRYNDIALLKTQLPIKFNERIQPTCLPFGPLRDEEAVLTSWSSRSGGYRDTSRNVVVQKYSQDECSATPYSPYNHTIHTCYGHRQNLEEAFWGNSGDPLIVDNNSSCIYAVIGILSYATSSTEPQGYTRVSHYIPWIESVMSQ